MTNPASARAASANAATTVGEPKPRAPASIAANVKALMATTPVSCPAGSNGTGRRGLASLRETSHNASAPTGTLRKKISRQSIMVSTPPRTGPAEDATAPPIAHNATARARAADSGNPWRINAIDAGIIAAAAAPCTNRAPTSTGRAGASPHAIEASTNTTIPVENARRAPTRSLTDPAVSNSAANIRV